MNSKKKSKWAVLGFVKAQCGGTGWQPLVTFFPRGRIEGHPELDGMDVVQEFVELGLVKEMDPKNDRGKSRARYEITELGLSKLSEKYAEYLASKKSSVTEPEP